MRLKFIILLTITLLSCIQGCPTSQDNTAKSHPHIFSNKANIEYLDYFILKNKEIKVVEDFIILESSKIVTQPLLKRKLIGKRLLETSREALKRIFYLSYTYQRTGEEKYAQRCLSELLNVSRFADWNPSHFLDVSEMALGVSIGYDWLYDYLSPKQRNEIENALKTKCLNPASNNSYNWFYQSNTNWNPVCNAGVLASALVLYREDPEMARKYISNCIESIPTYLSSYDAHGGFPEGYGYWSYGTLFQTMIFDLLQSAGINNPNNFNSDNFFNTGRFVQFMEAPSGWSFNFSDTYKTVKGNIPLWWLAVSTQDYSLIYNEIQLLKKGKIEYNEDRLLPLLLIFSSRLKNIKEVKPTRSIWSCNGQTPLFIFKSKWGSPNGTYLGIKGGSASTTHAHMDAGSFIYETDGIRWFDDLGGVNYTKIESNGIELWNMNQESSRWNVMRMNNAYHNTLSIDNLNHNVKGFAPIVHRYNSKSKVGAIIDLTDVLRAKKCRREISIGDKILCIKDTVLGNSSQKKLSNILVTSADTKILSSNKILLTHNNLKKVLEISSNAYTSIDIVSITPVHPYDDDVKNMRKIIISCSIPSDHELISSIYFRNFH